MPRKILSWTYPSEDPDVCEFEIYVRLAPLGTEGAGLGTRLGSVPAKERDFVCELAEGRYVGYVVPVGKNGSRGSSIEADAIDFIETGRDTAAPPEPASVALDQVDVSATALVATDPPSIEDTPHVLQVIEGGDTPMQGRLVAEHSVAPRGPLSPNASRQPARPIALDGSEHDDIPATRDLHVRGVTPHGKGGDAVTRSVNVTPRPNHDAIPVCSIIGSTQTNFSVTAPASSTSYEVVGGTGLRMRALTTGSSLSSALGTGSAGAIVDGAPGAQGFYQIGKVESDEVDLGAADLLFVLECFGRFAREDLVASRWTGRTGDTFRFPSFPAADLLGRENHPQESAWWAMRHLTGEGHPTQPLRECKFQYVVGSSSPVAHAEGDWKDHVPGATLRGRYVRIRVVMVEPTGFHRVICQDVIVTAHVVMRRRTGSGSPESAVAAGPGSLFTDKATGDLYHKATGYGNTGWSLMATAASAAGVPAGAVLMYAPGMGAPPTGWLDCDGTAVSRATYAALFAAIGTTYGVGDGSTTFNLPDFRDRFAQGDSAGGGGSNPVGGTGGAVSPTVTDPGHTHTVGTVALRGAGAVNTSAVANTGSNTTGITVPDGRPPFLSIGFIIKT